VRCVFDRALESPGEGRFVPVDTVSERFGRVLETLTARLEGHLEPLAREYVAALESAERLRAEAREKPFTTLKSGRVLLHPGFEAADRDARRAIQLAKALDLPKLPAVVDDPFAAIDAAGDVSSIASARSRRTKRGGQA
jgi:hypothetical protein